MWQKKKKIKTILISVLFAAVSVLCSCAQNDGEIGYLYGVWTLHDFYSGDIHISGEQCDGHSVRFQANIVQYVENLPYHDSRSFIGSWEMSPDSLLLSFPDVARNSRDRADDKMTESDVEVRFPILPSLGFKINTLSNSVLDISRTPDNGDELRYIFRKLN